MSETGNTNSLNSKEQLAQDLKTVDTMARWRKKLSKGENIKVKIIEKGMAPIINIGDVAEIMPVNTSNLKTGNIIFFRQNEDFLVRRISSIVFSGNGEFIVRGENLDYDEPRIAPSQIIGKVLAVERDGERIELERGFAQGLKKLGSMNIGGSSRDSEKSDEMLKKGQTMVTGVLNKVIGLVESGYSAVCSFVDNLISKYINK